jgi:integrase
MKVEAFKDRYDISRLRQHLKPHPRNYALFVVGINCGLRFSDLIRITVKDVQGLEVGNRFFIREKKTKKQRYVIINKAIHEAIERLLKSKNYGQNDPIFQGTIRGKALSYKSVNALVKNWAKWLGLSQNYGTHSLRKTFAYCQRRYGGVAIELIQRLFNHKNMRETMLYVGIEDNEIDAIPLNHEVSY